jgi:hypothetical protein
VTVTRIIFGMSALFALLFVFAFQRIPVPEPISVREAQFDESWNDVMQSFPLAKKTDPLRIISTDPKPVVVERVMPDVPAEEPVVDASRLRRTRSHRTTSGITKAVPAGHRDICRGKGKRYTHGGRSWRCRR